MTKKAKSGVYMVPVFFLDVAEPKRVTLDELDGYDFADHVKECMAQMLGKVSEPYVVPYCQVFPNPVGYRNGDAALRAEAMAGVIR